MSVGIISYLSARGLGNMCHDLRTQLGIKNQLVPPDAGWPTMEAWATGDELRLRKWDVDKADLLLWRNEYNVKTVVAIESPFGDRTFQYAKELGMRTILIVMWEAFNPHMPAYRNVDLYIAPSYKAYQEIPLDNKIFLPYPVDVENEFPFTERHGPAKVFVHNAGSGGMNGRKGTELAVRAFLRADVLGSELLIRSQVPFHTICSIDAAVLPQNIRIDYGSKPTRKELYETGHVLIYPSKLDGHALVTLEAMASGMPVITTDAPPMNEYWGADYPLLVEVAHRQPAGMVNPHCMQNIVSIDDLAKKIRWCATNDMGPLSRQNRLIAEELHSWTALRKRWKEELGV